MLNSVFLYHAIEAGLDAAIVNPGARRPSTRSASRSASSRTDLIFDRRDDALPRFIAHFDEHTVEARRGAPVFEGISTDERIHAKILHRRREGVEDDIDAALDERGARENDTGGRRPEHGSATGDEGRRRPVRAGRADLALRAAVRRGDEEGGRAPRALPGSAGGHVQSTVVLATVFGDVHDIGKNLVGTILSNNGYTVIDLGRQVPLNVIMDRAVEEKADAIGLSALLVSTSKQMPLALGELDHRGLRIPVLIGGAAINRGFGRRIAFLEDGRPYEPGVFYCKDAFEGLDAMDRLSDDDARDVLIRERREEALAARDAPKQAPLEDASRLRAVPDGHRCAVTSAYPTRRSSVRGSSATSRPPRRFR